MGAVQKARRGLIAAGFGAPLMACAARSDSNGRSWPEEQFAHLAKIAFYIGDHFKSRTGLLLGERVTVSFTCIEKVV